MSYYEDYCERYRGEFVDILSPRDVALRREAIERENKFKEAVRKLWERVRLK
jgi:hypothetical protein